MNKTNHNNPILLSISIALVSIALFSTRPVFGMTIIDDNTIPLVNILAATSTSNTSSTVPADAATTTSTQDSSNTTTASTDKATSTPQSSDTPLPFIVPEPAPTPVSTTPTSSTSTHITSKKPIVASTTKATTTRTSKIATSTVVVGSITQTPGADSNQVSYYNYYPALDNLSPEMTYALSGGAMAVGILGAIFILREPQEEAKRAWMPHLSESLLEQ